MFFTYPVPPPAVLSASRQRTAMRGGAWGRRTGVGAPAEDLDARAVLRVAHRDVVHEHVRDDVRLPRVLALDRERDGRQRAERARRTCPRLPTEMPCEPLHHMFCTTMLVEFGLNAGTVFCGEWRTCGIWCGLLTDAVVIVVDGGVLDSHI